MAKKIEKIELIFKKNIENIMTMKFQFYSKLTSIIKLIKSVYYHHMKTLINSDKRFKLYLPDNIKVKYS